MRFALTTPQYAATLEVLGRLWAARGNPTPLPDGATRRAWHTVPFSLNHLAPSLCRIQ